MNLSDTSFLRLLESKESYLDSSLENIAQLYVDIALSRTLIDYLIDHLWLASQKSTVIDFNKFLILIFDTKSLPLRILIPSLSEKGKSNLKRMPKELQNLELELLDYVLKLKPKEQVVFLKSSLTLIQGVFEDNKNLELYRTFDGLDLILNLNYELDKNMTTDPHNKERIFKNSGIGVQSGYYTILRVMEYVKPKLGARMVDLGSGYGRVGLVCSLLRPDIEFLGYEYVAHRVKNSNESSKYFALCDKLLFFEQDLSKDNFEIPESDIYYMYDPFSEATYRSVLRQVFEISKKMDITIVTKGDATRWVSELACLYKWPSPVEIKDTNVAIYRSKN